MWFLTHAWIIVALPALSFLIILLFGKRIGVNRAHWVGIPVVGVAFVLSLLTAGAWISHNHGHGEEGQSREAAERAALADVDGKCSNVGAAAAAGAERLPGFPENPPVASEDLTKRVEKIEKKTAGEEETPSKPVVRCLSWWQNGTGGVDAATPHRNESVNPLRTFTIGTMIDGPAVLMLVVVTLISLLVHIYSSDYVNGDRRYTHYYAFLSLFTAAMLFFVTAENTLQMIVGWELVGVCSFALIGHWWEEKPNSDAALKAFITNRVGDMGLLVGMIILFFQAGQTWNLIDINTAANNGGISHFHLTLAACCLIAAVMSKSGQFVLHTWLPDAMAGPTPVSALIHAATMVVAGIYLVARLYPVFWHGLSIGGSSINLLAVVGSVTALFGALLAFVQKDIKKVLAYSTVSQLGFMVAALGVGAWTAALFHLFTHAFFKACLFLGAGSLSHACHHSFNMVDDMGGLRKIMPKTYLTYMVGTASLIGIFPLAGFWSKDEILAGTGALNFANGTYYFVLIMLLVAAFCTAAYMTRTVWYAFFGEFRGHGHPHESGSRITVPLIILAVLGAVAGFANLPKQIGGLKLGDLALQFEHAVEPIGVYFPGAQQGFTHAGFNGYIAIAATLIGLAGVGAAYLYYWKGALKPLEGLAGRNRLAGGFKTVLENKYYLDWLYTTVIVGFVKKPLAAAAYWFNQKILDGIVNGAGSTTVRAGRWVYEKVDQLVVDGAVNGAAAAASGAGGELRQTQTGRIQQYATLFFAAAALLAGVFVVVFA